MKEAKSEQHLRQEFAAFVNAEPIAPGKPLDDAILKRVGKRLSPSQWKIYGKVTLTEVAGGLLTLTVCPQFGLGFGQHHPFLHTLHAATTPVVFYLLCGVFFVTLGAAISGLVLNRQELRSVGNSRFLFFAVYSTLAYLALLVLGTEAFVVASLFWVPGALLGNVLGFATATRLRFGAG